MGMASGRTAGAGQCATRTASHSRSAHGPMLCRQNVWFDPPTPSASQCLAALALVLYFNTAYPLCCAVLDAWGLTSFGFV